MPGRGIDRSQRFLMPDKGQGTPGAGGRRQHPINRLKQQIASGDIPGMQRTLTGLNRRLTGSNLAAFHQEGRQALQARLEEFQQHYKDRGNASMVISLGDGGNSRLVLRRHGKEVDVDISPVSTPKVTTLWERLTKQADKRKS